MVHVSRIIIIVVSEILILRVKGKKFMLNKKAMYTLTVSVNKNQNSAAFNNNPYITASHQAALIVHVSIKVFCLV